MASSLHYPHCSHSAVSDDVALTDLCPRIADVLGAKSTMLPDPIGAIETMSILKGGGFHAHHVAIILIHEESENRSF